MARQSPYISSPQFNYQTSYQQRDARYGPGSSVESAMALTRRPSLLAGYHNHFGSPERASLAPYYLSLAPVSMGPHVDEHSKRARYPTNTNLSMSSQLPPLSIDIKKEQQVYQPQTEAISPTPDDPKSDSMLRDSTIIRNSISKLDSEIDITQKKLQRARNSQNEIKSQADKSAADEENDDHDDLLRMNGSQTLIERILHDNRKKAEDGQKIFHQLNNNMDLNMPIYEEPLDMDIIEKIRAKYLNTMKKRLQKFFKKTHQDYKCRIVDESNRYDRIYQQWQKSIDKDEKLIANKDQTTYREIFEKTFPELRKMREDREKKQNNGGESSVADQQGSMGNVNAEQELENEEEKLRKSSIVPPIVFDAWQRKHQFFNQNCLIRDDAVEFYKERTKMPHWSAEEKQIFIEKFTQSPKNFGYISSFLENKTTEQCVQFYYMTKKTENYKNLLRKQSQANKRRAKQNAAAAAAANTVTSTNSVETTIVTKVTSFTSSIASSSQQVLSSTMTSGGQDSDRNPGDRLDNDEDRRDTNPVDGADEKRGNKNRCQLLSCTTEKTGKKKNRKNRLRAFPNKWNDLSNENREAIRRTLQIPQNVQRCCTRCYEKLIVQVRQLQNNNQQMEEEDDDDDESSKMPTTIPNDPTAIQDEEWNENDIDAFTEALNKFGNDWTQIAEYVRRSEQSCQAFYLKHRKSIPLPDDEQNLEEDNGSVSGSEETSRRLIISIKQRPMEALDDNDDDGRKTIGQEESNDSPHEMIIDEGDEHNSAMAEKNKGTTNNQLHLVSNLTTINSLVEKEICKTLVETHKRPQTNVNYSPEKVRSSPGISNPSNVAQPPPLVTLKRPHSPPVHSHLLPQTNLHLSPGQTNYATKGSIMRGTPVSSSLSPSNKPISIDTSGGHHPSRHFSSPRNEFNHSSSNYHDSSYMKSPKMNERGHEAAHIYLQQQQNPYARHYAQKTSSQYPPQQHRPSSVNSHPAMPGGNKSLANDPSNTDTFETLRADFVTSRYLTTTHSPSHERSRHQSEQRSPSQTSSASNSSQTLLPPPTTIATSNSAMQSMNHPHPSQQQAALLAASQLLASSGLYSQELFASGLPPYASYYNSVPGAPFFLDPRLMHELAAAAANNEQMKNLRVHHPAHTSTHSSSDMSSSYPSSAPKRHALDNIEHMRYASAEYPSSHWRSQNLASSQQSQTIHPPLKSNSGANENPTLKTTELSRAATRVNAAMERDTRSPDDYHHRSGQIRAYNENPSIHFPRSDLHSHHKSSNEKLNSSLYLSDHPNDSNSNLYLRSSGHGHKSQTSHHPQHFQPHHTTSSSSRSSLPPPAQISPNHPSGFTLHGVHSSTVATVSPRQQQLSSPHHTQSQHSQPKTSHHSDPSKNSKESISIQEYMKQNVNNFVSQSNTDNKNVSGELATHDNSGSQLSRIPQSSVQTGVKLIDNQDQPILIEGDDDSNSMRESNETNNMSVADANTKLRSNQDLNKHNTTESELTERRRDSSIKKILSNQPLEKQEYVEINQKVQNSSISASKVHSSSDLNGLERSNSAGSRETTRSRGSITMRMLMGANGIYADGKAQPLTASELSQETINKNSAALHDKGQSLEYLIRGELDRACPTVPKRDDSASSVFQSRHQPTGSSSPSAQQRSSSSQATSISKRMRMSPKDEGSTSSNEYRSQPQESSNNLRDPFVLQSHSKSSHHPTVPHSTGSGPTLERPWQSFVQQQSQHLSNPFATRISRSPNITSGSITQGSPVSPSMRSSTDASQYPSASNNQLVNPRYSYYINKNESQQSPSAQSFQEPSLKSKLMRTSQQSLASPSDHPQYESSLSQSSDHSSNLRSPPINPMLTVATGNTPPTISSPVSSSASPTTSVSSNSAHPLKKRLISEYEHEQQQQQRNSPTTVSPNNRTLTSTSPPVTNSSSKPEATSAVDRNIEDISDGETTVTTLKEDTEPPA